MQSKDEYKRLATIEEAIADIGAGKMIILVDDEDRENEGDLVVAADQVSAQDIAFMAREGRGLICLALGAKVVERLNLAPMAENNRAPLGTAFTVSVDARDGIETGLSAEDRAHSIRVAMAEDSRPTDLISPGHVFPLRARRGGVLVRSGQTEGSVDLARLAGRPSGAVICEIMKPDGCMARLPDLLKFGEENKIRVATVEALIEYRLKNETLVQEMSSADLPTDYGLFRIRVFRSCMDDLNHVVLQMGEILPDHPTLVRVHRANLTRDIFARFQKDGDAVLRRAMSRISEEGRGVLLYLDHQDGRWPGMIQNDADSGTPFRSFGVGAQILRELGLRRIRVMSSAKRSYKALKGFGLKIEGFEE
jgi:3,4-dihydroxy 2-butanone 4-phosphate synthase/GTP cyclohydrolase II